MDVVFDDHECTCEHPPSVHDDGFGCTERSCDCVAGWSIARPEMVLGQWTEDDL